MPSASVRPFGFAQGRLAAARHRYLLLQQFCKMEIRHILFEEIRSLISSNIESNKLIQGPQHVPDAPRRANSRVGVSGPGMGTPCRVVTTATGRVSRPNDHMSSMGYNCRVAPVHVFAACDRDTAGKGHSQYQNHDG